MTRTREVGTLWIGGALSWLEQVCLKSFVDAGQKITLFCYEDIPNVPDGVIIRDGRDVLDTDDFIKYEKKDSFALFADMFRIHMIYHNPGMIWIDTDVYCVRPLDYDGDYVFGFELPGEQRINNAVLGMPARGALIEDIMSFLEDRYSIAPFLKPKMQAEFRAAADAGSPVHVSAQPWGVWGPMMITHFVHKHGLIDKVQPLDAFYPITFPDRRHFLRPAAKAEAAITDATTGLHVWASNKRTMGLNNGGRAPEGSYLDVILKRHGINPDDAPIKGRGRHVFDAGLVDAVDLADVQSFGDLSGTAQSLALAAHAKWDCDLYLIDVTETGTFPDTPSDWVAPYVAFLTENGVAKNRIHTVGSMRALKPVDVIANLSAFGDLHKIKHLKDIMPKLIHSDSRMILDIRKGSGAFPFLKDFGSCAPITTRDDGGQSIARVLFTPTPPTRVASDPEWAKLAVELAGPKGFYTDNGMHSFLYIPRGKTLVVTFDNLDIAMNKREDRRPWGFDFIQKQGWSMLGVMANGWTWYRDDWVTTEFNRLRDEGFFAGFDRVVFYGASMGGYAACAFSGAHPGADVVAISPQSTLDKSIVPWESRYKVAWDSDFSGPYGDAALCSGAARRISILYDPYEPLDAGHVDRFTGANVVKLRTPLLGHRLGSSLSQMGILTPIILGALNGTLSELDFYRALRARHEFGRYQRELFKRALDRGHTDLARQLGRYVLKKGDNRFIRQAMASL